ncbi:MAG: MAPEG family protein [Pseudorhodoplanes sp.]
MTVQMILLPLFVQVLLTIALGVLLAVRRRRALMQGTRWQDIALREPNWPKDCIATNNAFTNQFEIPVLFYVLTILALITKQADLTFVVMAWIFVLMRVLQAGVFVTSNHVPTRGAFFAIGVIVLVIMWIIYMVRILTLPGL